VEKLAAPKYGLEFQRDWTTGQGAELESIQDFLRSRRFALPPLPQEPAADVLAALDGLTAERGERAGIDSMVETLNGSQLLDHFLPARAGSGGDWKDQLIRFYVRSSSPSLRAENLLYCNLLWDP
jgi:hypothetical protein